MSILSWMTIQVDERGLWTCCHQCGAIIYLKHLRENDYICSSCEAHLKMNGRERLDSLIDPGTWQPFDETLSSVDPLNFTDQRSYIARLKDAQFQTNFQEAVITGTGLLDEIPVALAIMDFNFMGGSMGSVVGEKITRLIEYATHEGLVLIIVCASGGARMQEGVFSLMQMAKISAALNIYQQKAKLMYISVLTSPTTGGVTASFAMLGDLILAEPNALIGFAGRRVIQQTLQEEEELPDNFQTAEYFLDHGLLDLIVSRDFLKVALFEIINLYYEAPLRYRTQTGKIPPNLFKSSDFLSEEKFRRKLKKRNYRNALAKKTKAQFSKDDLPRIYKNAEKVFNKIKHTNKQNLSISNRKQRKLIKFNQKMFQSLNLLYNYS
nr:acetyl-CoA carboxylase beta subunit [Poropsis sp. ID1_4]